MASTAASSATKTKPSRPEPAAKIQDAAERIA
jgi:hypothetical protein